MKKPPALPGVFIVSDRVTLQIERRVLRARNRGSFRIRRGGFFRVGGGIAGHALQRGTSARTVRPQASARASVRIRRGIRQRLLRCHRFFQHQETATHRRTACRPYISAGYHMPPCPPEKLLLAFKYTRPGVVTVNSSITVPPCCEAAQQNRTVLRFCMVQCFKACAPAQGRVPCTRAPRKRRLWVIITMPRQQPQQTARAAVCMVQCSSKPVRQHRGVCLAHARRASGGFEAYYTIFLSSHFAHCSRS
jgi:hypothetical protein